MKIRELPDCERPREKLLSQGRESLSNRELLGILIGSGTGGKSAMALAEEILSLRNDGIIFLSECSIEELAQVKGVGLAKASQVVAAAELGRRMAVMPRVKKIRVNSTGQVASLFMEKMRYYKKEVFDTLLLDAKGGIIAIENVAIGDISTSIVHPRETFKKAVQRGAYAVILIHNHPSGDPKPSPEDIEVTKRLEEAGNILGIKVLDHVIIGDGEYISLKSQGLF